MALKCKTQRQIREHEHKLKNTNTNQKNTTTLTFAFSDSRLCFWFASMFSDQPLCFALQGHRNLQMCDVSSDTGHSHSLLLTNQESKCRSWREVKRADKTRRWWGTSDQDGRQEQQLQRADTLQEDVDEDVSATLKGSNVLGAGCRRANVSCSCCRGTQTANLQL